MRKIREIFNSRKKIQQQTKKNLHLEEKKL